MAVIIRPQNISVSLGFRDLRGKSGTADALGENPMPTNRVGAMSIQVTGLTMATHAITKWRPVPAPQRTDGPEV